MTPADKIIFAVGVFSTLLLLGGVLFTILEFRKIGQHPERYKQKPDLVWLTGDETTDTSAANKE